MNNYTKTTALERINALPNKDKRTILKSQKDFIIFDIEGRYTLTNDLFRHRHAYQWGGSFAALSCIKQDIKPSASFI